MESLKYFLESVLKHLKIFNYHFLQTGLLSYALQEHLLLCCH